VGKSYRIAVGDLETGTSRVLAGDALDPSYVSPGILLYGQADIEGKMRVWARRFDPSRLSFSGQAVAISDPVRAAGGVMSYTASDGLALAYLPGRGDNGEIVTDRTGRILDTVNVSGAWMHRWARAHAWIAARTGTTIYKVDVDRHTQSVLRRGALVAPVWSPGDSLIALGGCVDSGARTCGLVVTRLADGHDSLLTTPNPNRWSTVPTSWSNDGRYLVYYLTTGFLVNGSSDAWVYDFAQHSAKRAIGVPSGALEAAISPDDRWLAYRSIETGTWEVYVRPFQRNGVSVRVSTAGGRLPLWNANGRELLFQAPDGNVTTSEVRTSGEQFEFSPPHALLMAPAWSRHTFFDMGTSYDATPDAQRFAFRRSATGSDETGTAIVLVDNWRALLK
jgi:hypothetical protein